MAAIELLPRVKLSDLVGLYQGASSRGSSGAGGHGLLGGQCGQSRAPF